MSLSRCRSQWVFLVFLVVCFFYVVPSSRAQRRIVENVSEGPIYFSIDSVPLYDPSAQTSWLVIFYKVANDHLQFIKVDGGYRADFQVVYVVYDRDRRQVSGDVFPNTQWAGTYDQTNSREAFVQGHFEFPLAPGDYEIQVWIEGQHAGEMVRTSRKFSVPSFGDFSLAISGLLLSHQIWPLGAPGKGYERNGLIMVPSVDHFYSDLLPQLSCYFEIYDQEEAEALATSYEGIFEIINSSDEVVLTDTTSVPRQGHLSYGYHDFQVSSLDEDQYVLQLMVKDSGGERTAKGKTWFQMRWSALGQVAKDYEEAIEQLRYIATDQEYKELKAVQGEERREAWLKFWERRDPTPGSPTNEMKTEYYRRIEYANAQFSVVSPGWKTDRGRIYIIHGAPDDIEHHPMEIGMKPYQIWHYYSTNRLFYFVDEDGYGDYKLIAWR